MSRLSPRRRLAPALLCGLACASAAAAATSEWVYRGQTGRLIYRSDADGDRVLDFSDVGYRGGTQSLPAVPATVLVSPAAGDDTAAIQAAIDQVAAAPLGPDGFRGAVQLAAGDYQIGGQLRIRASGVVLRGAGQSQQGTVLHATGTSQRDLIQIVGSGSQSLFGGTGRMIDKKVPVGATSFRVDSTATFAVGDTVRVTRPSTAEWIADIGMDSIPPRSDGGTVHQWAPGSFDLRYDRVITRIEGDRVFVDAPLANSFELQYGGGTIRKYSWPGRIENVGVENLRAESSYASATDENHSWNFVTIDDAQHVWVRNTTSAHFARSAVLSHPGAKWVTVDGVTNLSPKSQITGSRRYTFDLSGQLELVTGSEANQGRHDFVNNSTRPPGPHVFHDSVANDALSDSGPHQRWATGSLFDNIIVDGHQINVRNRGNFGTGHGWAGANMVIWNSTAASYIVQNPPTAQNWIVGSTGHLLPDNSFGPHVSGYVDSHAERVDIDSLYEAQVADASDVADFHWAGGEASWSDPDAWAERLTPGRYAVSSRDYLIGDIDGFTPDGALSVDDAPIDPAWRAAIESGSALPVVGFDDLTGNTNVAFTIEHVLDPGERVVHGSLALALQKSGGVVDTDFLRLFNSAPENRRSLSDLGWADQISDSAPFVGVVDLGSSLEHLQAGSVNVQLNDDVGVDWALYTVTVATPREPLLAESVSIRAGVALVEVDVGAVGALSVGGEDAGALRIDSGGRLHVTGDYEQSPEGALLVEVGPSGGGALSVGGAALLDGDLRLLMADGYTPAAGDEFELLRAGGALGGAFDSVSLPTLGGGLRWTYEQSQNSLLASVVLTGDYNADGRVDAADYTLWRDTLGSTTDLAADGDNDGQIGPGDYAAWAASYGAASAPSPAVPPPAVPEPGAFALLLGAATASVTGRRPDA
ncbi:hypothetical protein [Botrimarina sp.]|uniref:hypothetical protein n=1 Tax=Botrimarina sp. TaxID=2795802 RepID=UPI0032ED807B